MATGGFSFGGTSTPAAGGFSFGAGTTQNAAPTQSGGLFAFGSAAKTTASGLTLGTAASASGGFNFAKPVTTTTPSSQPGLFGSLANPAPSTGGFGVNAAAAQPGTGLSFGGTVAATTTTTTVTTSGFSFGGAGGATTTQTPSLVLPGTSTAQTATTGLQFGTTPQTSGFSFGLNTNTNASTTPSLSLAMALGTKTTAPTLTQGTSLGATGLGGLLGMQSSAAGASTTAAGGLFSMTTTTQSSVGLGGVAVTSGGTGSSVGKASESKALKEIELPPVVASTVTTFQQHVKEEKGVREDIARMSNKAMLKVQEDAAALRQLLAVVSNGLQRNACAVDKLKHEMTRELKNAEMAQRTKDIPDGLQYENTAPTLYFQELLEDFEGRMQTYRQQIENLENHLAALHQPARHSPAELIALLKKLNETFIVLAAQLQQVHESVGIQKEQYKTYRKIFHGDSKNIFEQQSKPTPKPPPPRPLEQAGPNPFSGLTNAAAAAMASVLNRSQQPAGAPPVAGLASGTLALPGSALTHSVMGTAFPTPSTGLNTGGLNPFATPGANPTASAAPGLGGALFGSQSVSSVLPSPQNLSASTNRPFQLNKPPTTAKRGRR